MRTHIFRTSYRSVNTELPLLLRSPAPRTVLVFGYAPSSNAIRLERTARNETPAALEDVEGQRHEGSIVESGPPQLSSTLALGELNLILGNHGFAVAFSDDAGGYVCNYAFYLLQHLAKELGITHSGLIHLPNAERYRQQVGHPPDYGAVVRLIVDSVQPQ